MSADRIQQIEEYVRQWMDTAVAPDLSIAHDWKHVDRVRGWALRIAREEGLEDLELVEAAALLHDVGLACVEVGGRGEHAAAGAEIAARFLRDRARDSSSAPFTEPEIAAIAEAIQLHSSPGGGGPLAQVLRDADKLDALGTVGIMRAFTSKYAQPEYDPRDVKGDAWGMPMAGFEARFAAGKKVGEHIVDQINFQISFYDELHTETARRIAQPLVEFVKAFLVQLEAEVDAVATHRADSRPLGAAQARSETMVGSLPRAILFDLDDTILAFSAGAEPCWRQVCEQFATHVEGLAPDGLLAAIQASRTWFWADPDRDRRGRLNLEQARREIVAAALHQLGVDAPTLAQQMADAYARERDESVAPFPGAVEALQRLRDRGARLALITNGTARDQRRKIDRFGLAPLFDCILIEGEVGVGKPDERTYRLALDRLGVQAEEACMVGDNLEWDVWAPQRLGMRGIWVDWAGTGLPASSSVRPDGIIRSLVELEQGFG